MYEMPIMCMLIQTLQKKSGKENIYFIKYRTCCFESGFLRESTQIHAKDDDYATLTSFSRSLNQLTQNESPYKIMAGTTLQWYS